MEQKSNLSFKLELIWWIFTAILVAGILYPIFSRITNYPFLVINVIFIIVFITFSRYTFLLKYTWLAHRKMLKAVIIALCIPVLFTLISELNTFQTILDEEGMDAFMLNLNLTDKMSLQQYIRNEVILFGTGAIIATVLLAFRLAMSIWRNHNRGTV